MDRMTKALLAALMVGVCGLLAYLVGRDVARIGATDDRGRLTLEELTVQRLNIVDAVGKARIILSGQERFPNPVVAGKEYPRSISPAGLVFYKSNGDEVGGIALVEVGDRTKNFMIFDYSNSEAIGWGISEAEGGEYSAGITLLDRVPLDADIGKTGSVGKERISISNENGMPEFVLKDPQGKRRVRLFLDQSGAGKFEILDGDGEVVFAAPQ